MVTSSTGVPSFSAGTPTFEAKTMSKGQLALLYGLKKTEQLTEWCRRVGITLPPRVHLLNPALVANIVEKLGAPVITISSTRM